MKLQDVLGKVFLCRDREVLVPPYKVLVTLHLAYRVQFWLHAFKEDGHETSMKKGLAV